ncbi:quinolinate synthase, partial [Burkholderia multivorans]
EYRDASAGELRERIIAAKAALGDRVVVLGHHYQRVEVVEHADYIGDSFMLAKAAQNHPDAEAIVFCGVHFMAETADLLSTPEQSVILPNLAAGCSMADMATI